MSASILLEIQRKQATIAREAIEGWLTTGPDFAPSVGLGDLLCAFLDTPERMRQARTRTFTHLLDQQADSDALMEELRGAFDEAASLLGTLERLAHDAAAKGHVLPGAAGLDKAIRNMAALREETFARWERFTFEDEQRAKAEMQRGEFLELDDAMAQAAGVDKETWLRTVAERRRSWPGVTRFA